MESFTTPFLHKSRISRISDMVTSFTNRQEGFQTILLNTLAILLSVTILFLLAQVYLIFLPCLKALLWALLCGSALYPFKTNLNAALQSWFDALEQSNGSFCLGLITLPFKLVYHLYWLLMKLVASNKTLFVLFLFRFQICHALSILCSVLVTILSHNKGIITAFVIICVSGQTFSVLSQHSNRIFPAFLSSFNFVPSILLLTFFYVLHCVGLAGHILFTILAAISLAGFFITVYNFIRNPKLESASMLVDLVNLLNERIKQTLKNWFNLLLSRFRFSEDSTDNGKINFGHLYISLLFTIFLFVFAEKMQVAWPVFYIFCVHWLMLKLFSKLMVHFSSFVEVIILWCSQAKEFIFVKLQNDVFFRCWTHFFFNGDQLIMRSLKNSLDLLTSVGLILTVTVLIILFSTILSVKIYGECYSTIYLLRNELSKIEYIKEGINLTLIEMTNVEYLNNVVKHNVLANIFNLKEDDKVNKMLFDFGETIIAFLNSSRSINSVSLTADDLTATESVADLNLNKTAPLIMPMAVSVTNLVKSLSSNLQLKKFNFEIIFNFVNSIASSYLPLLKSFLSILYAFIFIILDSSSVVLSFLLNSVIFTLALFYLLSISRDKYKPIELLDNLVVSLFEQHRFSIYVEEVVNSIFAATIKISAFYGIYTWLLHTLFDLQICCIPSVIAAILAAVPILNAYWASFPACLYLYYFDLNLPLLKSTTMLALAIAPSFVVDSSIYSDIKRAGHPYLTGLAITCGVVYYGVEGALFGPLWLCFLFIILNMCTTLAESNSITSTPT